MVYFAALKVGVRCHNCLEIPVLWCIAVGRDEEHDLEAVAGGYSCEFDSLGDESMVRGLEMPVRRCPLLKGLKEGGKHKGETGQADSRRPIQCFNKGRQS